MVKAAAITSLTVPKISSGKLRAVVPFSFWVQRLGEYLDVDIQGFGRFVYPGRRFLRQLELDYRRWYRQ